MGLDLRVPSKYYKQCAHILETIILHREASRFSLSREPLPVTVEKTMGNEEITKRKKKVTNQAIHDLELRRWVGGMWAERSAAGSRQPWAAVEAGGVRNLGFRVGVGFHYSRV